MKAKTKNAIKTNLAGYLLITPLLISLVIFTIYPLLLALFQSFFQDLTIKKHMVYDWGKFGFSNYAKAFNDSTFWNSLRLTLIYSIISIPINIVLSFLIAYALSKDFKGAKVFRVLYYLPCVIPGIVAAIIYKYIYSGESFGFFNSFLYKVGLRDLTTNDPLQFFDSEIEAVSMASFISMGLFSLGGASPFWIAGFKSIPKSYYEAAELDGISKKRIMFKITIPMMSKYIFYQLICSLIGAFQVGQGILQYSNTGGNGHLYFLGLFIYETSQSAGGNNFGYASALSYILFIFIAGLSVIMFKFNKFVYYEGDDK